MRSWLIPVHCATLLCIASFSATSGEIRSLERLLQTHAREIDFAAVKIAIDATIDPSTDATAINEQLDALVAGIARRFPVGASNRTKLDVLLSSLYEPGPWNDQHPFQYDLDDPFGKVLRNKLLSRYLATRKGNCVSMPVLLVILGQKLGLPVTLATAPEHLLVKYLDADGQWLNIEATAGGFKYDSSYAHELGISPRATANGVYLRPLGPGESAGAMLSTVMEFHAIHGRQAQRIAVADLALTVNPKDVMAMIHKGAAYYVLLQERYVSRYPDPADIPAAQRTDFQVISRENLAWYAKAEALGWRPPTQAQDANYLRNIQRERSNRKN